MGKITERFRGSILEAEHEAEFSDLDTIVIERTSGRTRIELPKGIESGLVLEIIKTIGA